MIRTSADTPLSIAAVKDWIAEFKKNYLPNLHQNKQFYLNSNGDDLPYAKKIVTISAAATIGDGITLKLADKDEAKKRTFDALQRLFTKQIISYEDLSIITQGCTYGVAYELAFMSSDEIPVPKCKWLDACSTFVVFDDTVEDNSLYGVYFNEITEGKTRKTEVYVFDETYKYTLVLPGHITTEDRPLTKRRCDGVCFSIREYDGIENVISIPENIADTLVRYEPHNMGRMPITVFFNNNDEQGDFEQVKPTILARNKIHQLAMEDAETIAGNYLVFVGNEIAGGSDEEKARTIRKIGRTKVIEIGEGEDVRILTKQETFSMIAVYGKDVENKIYDLSMVINFSSEEFAGNVTGVALRLKLFPFKRLVQNKDYFIERLYRRRLKMYMHGLAQLNEEYAVFDASDVKIDIKRTWEENLLELAQTIAQLASTNLFSEKTLIELMPNGEYEVEIRQRTEEEENGTRRQAASVGLDNSYFGDYAAELRQRNTAEGESDAVAT